MNACIQVELPTGIELIELQIVPTAWVKHVSVRTELLGCHKEISISTTKTTTIAGETTTTTKAVLNYSFMMTIR